MEFDWNAANLEHVAAHGFSREEVEAAWIGAFGGQAAAGYCTMIRPRMAGWMAQ